jgi:hypothetical protein
LIGLREGLEQRRGVRSSIPIPVSETEKYSRRRRGSRRAA